MIAHFKERAETELPLYIPVKPLARRQKFREYYDGFERVHTVLSSQEMKENHLRDITFRPSQRDVTHRQHKQTSKHNEHFFKKVASTLKHHNEELDEVRGECLRYGQQKREKKRGHSLPWKGVPGKTANTQDEMLGSTNLTKTNRDPYTTMKSTGELSRVIPFTLNCGKKKEISHHITRKTKDTFSSDSMNSFQKQPKRTIKTQLYKTQKR